MFKRMKTMIAVLLIVLSVVSLCACSKQTSSLDDDFDELEEALESRLAETTLTSNDDDDTDVDEGADDDDESDDSSDILPSFDKSPSIGETVLAETFGVRITATGIEINSYSVDVQLKIENLTDSTRTVHSGTAGYCCNSVNGYMIQDGYLLCEVEAGETKEDEVSFSMVELNVRGITAIADIELAFEITDEEYNSEKTEPIPIKTTIAGRYNYSEDTYLKTIKGRSLQNAYGIKIDKVKEEELYSEGGVTMLSEALMTNKDGEKSLLLEFDNNSGQTLYVLVWNLSVNDVPVYEYRFINDMAADGKKLVSNADISYYIKDVSELEGKNIQKVSFEIELYNADFQQITQSQPVTIDF